MNNINKILIKKKIIFSSLLILCLTMGFSYCYSYLTTKGTIDGTSSNILVYAFEPTVNDSNTRSQSIDLVSTITNDMTLAPGAEGRFKLDVSLNNSGLYTYYRLYYDNSTVPNNLHFYVDKEFTTELTEFEGVYYDDISDVDRREHYIYWKWDYVDSEEANANDNLFMNQNISVDFKVDVIQHLEDRTIKINDTEDQTGTWLSIGKKGSIRLNLDFSNIGPTNYKIFFDYSGASDFVHFYSDPDYTNEITNISEYYDGSYNQTTKTIYWKTDDSGSVYDTLYYVVVFE